MKFCTKLIFVVGLILFTSTGPAQQKMTTVILIRHAEKMMDGSSDPDLTELGRSRALLLADLLSKTKIDAIYSTHYRRTENTVAPLAQRHSLTVQNYDGGKMPEVDAMLAKHQGGTIVICGHSNTTPAIINYLTGHKDEFKNFGDADYGNLVIVSWLNNEGKVTWLRYGN
ncbi:MAG: phosphoglycerate mutase family protein [Cyclobacteriaceae bacterium]|nr:phosphoglycerate mutase family protein [Cyclobacteriaceae bacterium]